MMAKRCRVSFEDDENVLKLIVAMIAPFVNILKMIELCALSG